MEIILGQRQNQRIDDFMIFLQLIFSVFQIKNNFCVDFGAVLG